MRLFVILAFVAVLSAETVGAADYVHFNPQEEAKDACYYCVKNVEVLYSKLNNTDIPDIIDFVMPTICNLLQSPLKEQCVDFVPKIKDEWLPLALFLMTDPTGFCQLINMCKNPSLDEVLSNFVFQNDETCELCQQGMGIARMLFSDKEAQEELLAELVNACSLVPAAQQPICQTLLKFYATPIVDSISTDIKNPLRSCKKLRWCSRKAAAVDLQVKPSANKCDTCRRSIVFFHEILVGRNNTILRGIQYACANFPEPLQGRCAEIGLIVYHYAAKDTENPNKVCNMLNFCKKPAARRDQSTLNPPIGFPIPTIECGKCVNFTNLLWISLKNDTAREGMKGMLGMACLMSPEVKQCQELVANYFDEMWNILVAELAAGKEICQVLKCTPQEHYKKQQQHQKHKQQQQHPKDPLS